MLFPKRDIWDFAERGSINFIQTPGNAMMLLMTHFDPDRCIESNRNMCDYALGLEKLLLAIFPFVFTVSITVDKLHM